MEYGLDTLAAIFAIGLFAGFLNVIVGSGSSIIIPILIFLGLPPHVAIGTNRFAMLFNNLTGAATYYTRKRLDLRYALFFAAMAGIGGIIGSNAVLMVDPSMLKYIIGAILLVEVIIVLFTNKKIGVERHPFAFTKRHYLGGTIFSFLIGLYGGFIGMATSLTIFFFVYFYRFRFIESAALSKAIVFAISLFASIVFIINDKIDFTVGIVLILSYVIGAYLGVNSAIKLGDARVKLLFITILILSAFKIFFF